LQNFSVKQSQQIFFALTLFFPVKKMQQFFMQKKIEKEISIYFF